MLLIITASLTAAPWSLICLIIALILLFLAAFVIGGVAEPSSPAPFYRRINFGWAGIFFLALAQALR
jgi:hypothetical protein